MTLLGVMTYAALLWFLLAVESMNVSTPGNGSSHVTDKQLTSQHDVTTWYPDTDDDITENMELIEETHSAAVLRTSAAATSSSAFMLHASTAVTTAAEGDAHSHTANITETVKPMEKRSAAAFTDTSASATTLSATVAASPPQPTSITDDITSTLSSTISSDESVQNLSSPLASPTTPKSQTSESTSGFNHTSLASETSTELPSTSQSIPATRTSQPPDTTAYPHNSTSTAGVLIPRQPKKSPPATTISQSPNPTASTSISTGPTNSTSTAGVLIPRQPKKSPPATTTSTTLSTTAAPCQVPKEPPRSEDLPCSTRGVVKPCLIAIAALAGLATIFMVTTIILCAKLPQRRYKVRKPQQATEMMCISALLPDTTTTRPRNHVPNGVLVFPGCADSDEDGGDNLTLSSFLPENDRYV